jgi:type IV pilus assembly protein PilY1
MFTSLKAKIAPVAAATAFVLLGASARSEDIDIFAYPPQTASRADVLIVLDSSANWSSSISEDDCSYADGGSPKASNPGKEQGTKMAIEKCALYNLIHALPEDQFNVGLMLFNESPADISGGYPRHAIVTLDAAGKASLKTAIRNLAIGDDKGNNAAFSKSLYEAYLYLTEQDEYRGQDGTKEDSNAFLGSRYRLPTSDSCSKHIIFVTNGRPGEVTDNEAETLLKNLQGSVPTRIAYTATQNVSNSDAANWADEFARFMYSDASIRTHTVAVTGASSDGNYPNFIKNIAAKGGGHYESAANSETLVDALSNIFARIQSVSSVFSSASLPVSVNARGTYENQIFLGMFLPDQDARPRWVGNLKQYKFSYDHVTDKLILADAEGKDAINNDGGFIAPDAVSFWTHSSSFWANAASGTPASTSDSPDGEIVAKGGAAQLLRDANLTSQSSRLVYTCIASGSAACATGTLGATTATRFDTSNSAITAANLGVSASERSTLIEWVRGADNMADESGPGGGVTVRPSIHGDVLHSRPAVVNYGGSTGVVVFYGSNDGMLHAVNGNQTGTGAGSHLWSFVPEEHFSKLPRLRNNAPLVSFPSLATTDPVAPRDYFVDGPISVYQKLDSDGDVDDVYMYVGMRRGGRFIYAFDVSNPSQPSFKWKKTSADIGVLGQTWSEPRVAKIRGRTNPVIIMGAGYDAAAEDVSPAGTTTMGNAVLVLDAFTGDLIRSFDTERSVPADVTMVDSDSDGYSDRAYAVDVGGNIYRIDFELTDSATNTTATGEGVWEINTLASLGSQSKKFLYAPDVVVTRNFAIVMAGTGDREKPLSDSTQDYFYTVIDRQLGKGVGADFETISASDLVAQASYASSPDAPGCFVELAPGEKIVNAPTTIGGMTYFSTNKPTSAPPNSCSANLGEARAYAVPLVCKAPKSSLLEGGGLPPTSVAGDVLITWTDDEGVEHTESMIFIMGGANTTPCDDCPSTIQNDSGSPFQPSDVDLILNPKRSKVYWYTETER